MYLKERRSVPAHEPAKVSLSHNRQQRIFSAMVTDAARLKHMAAVLEQRQTTAFGRASQHNFLEEVQLYAVTLEELAVQVSMHSPALAEIASSLYRGFTRLFHRVLNYEESRLAQERAARVASLTDLTISNEDAKGWREAAKAAESELSAVRAALEVNERALSDAKTAYLSARTEARSTRSMLDCYLGIAAGDAAACGGSIHPTTEQLQESIAKVDACAQEVEEVSTEVVKTADQLHMMVRATLEHEPLPLMAEASCQTEEVAKDEASEEPAFAMTEHAGSAVLRLIR